MEFNLEPVKVDLQIETPSLGRDAFYSLCFITENDEAPRTLKVERLRDLLDNGYDRLSLAYNFCVGVFAQQGMDTVYIRAKRLSESYEDAFSADDNSDFYFVVIESKDLEVLANFNRYIKGADEYKLHFYSNNAQDLTQVSRGKVVNYYHEFDSFTDDLTQSDPYYYLKKAYGFNTGTRKLKGGQYPLQEWEVLSSQNTEVLSMNLRQSDYTASGEFLTDKTNIDNVSLVQVLFETIHDKNQTPEAIISSNTSIVNDSIIVTQVLFEPINLSGLPYEFTRTENTSLEGGSIVQVLWKPVEHRNIESEKHMSIGTTIDSIGFKSLN